MIATVLAMQSVSDSGGAIVFIPEGKHTITPTVDGKPKRVTVNVEGRKGELIAANLQRDLEKRLASNVRPFFDFDHKDTGPAAAIPKRIFWEDGKGVMAEVDWTGAGKSAIEARDYSYFSPVFLLSESGEPAGLPMRGPLGALVNDPAFRDIPRIAAANAAQPKEETKYNKPTIMKELVVCGLLTNTEAAKDDASSVAAARVTAMRGDSDKLKDIEAKITALTEERDQMKKKLEAANAEVLKSKEANADSVVKAAVDDGRIAPKDEETQNFYRDLIVEKGDSAVKALNALPKPDGDVTKQKVSASGQKVSDSEGTFEAEADKLVAAGDASDREEAFAIVASNKPELYQSYCDSLGE